MPTIPMIAPSMLYAYAALLEGVPFANGAPNLTVDTPVLRQYATEHNIPISGKDFKTGQTLIKTVLAPMLKARQLGLAGVVLHEHPRQPRRRGARRPGELQDEGKRVQARCARGHPRAERRTPTSTATCTTRCGINYYPPRGDNKEGWDNIDIFGWLGYPMQIKVDFLCRDSILAAPLALDLVLFSDLAQRAGMGGIQEWLSFYYKSPQVVPGLYPEHDLFIQLIKLKNTLRWMMGEDQITHLGLDYYTEV